MLGGACGRYWSRAPILCGGECFSTNWRQSLAVADQVVLADVFKSEAIPEAERLDPAAVIADLKASGKPARLLANADAIVGNHRARVAAGGCGGDLVERRLWRNLREASGETEIAARGGDHRVSRFPATVLRRLTLWLTIRPVACRQSIVGRDSGHLQLAQRVRNRKPTEYFVSLADPSHHLAHVSIRLPQGSGIRSLDMPVWNALYQVRNFAANIEDVRAQDATGSPAVVLNTKTSEWEITAPAGCVVISYDIHLDSPRPFRQQLECRPWLLQLGDGADVLAGVALPAHEHSPAGCAGDVGDARSARPGLR